LAFGEHAMRNWRLRYLLPLCALLCATAAWAPPILPPWVALSDPNVSISAGRFTAAEDAQGRWTFEVESQLRGDPPATATLLVRMPHTSVRPEIGLPMIIAHSAVRSAPMKPRRVVSDESQRAVLSIEGLPAALFNNDDRWTAALLRSNPYTPAQGEYRTTLFLALEDEDAQWASLWAAELAVRWAELMPFSRREQDLLSSFVQRTTATDAARAALLTTALDHQPAFGVGFVAAAATILSDNPLSAAKETPALLYAALLVAEAHPEEVDGAVLARWLRSTPVHAERAAFGLRARSPDLEARAVERALAELPADSAIARFLREHKGRMLTP
jgi:hypothetical protein